MTDEEHCDVLVLGAGAAGIGAARRLLEEDAVAAGGGAASWRVIVLEARERAGGRAWTSDELRCGLPLDHGGKWIHGSTSRHNPVGHNPMTKLARQHRIPTTAWIGDRDSTEFCKEKRRRKGEITRVVLPVRSGDQTTMQASGSNPMAEDAAGLLFKQLCQFEEESLIAPLVATLPVEATYKDCLLELAEREMPGRSFDDWLEAKAKDALRKAIPNGVELGGSLVEETIAQLRLLIYYQMESYEGCRLDQCSLHHTEDGTILSGRNADIAGGYGNLVSHLATSVPIDIRYNQRVKSIDRNTRQASVLVCAKEDRSQSEKQFVARLGCIVALPLGVLQPCADNLVARDPIFIPPLPQVLLDSVDKLGMCLMNKIEILFPTHWWPQDDLGSLAIATTAGHAANNFPLGDMPWSDWLIEGDKPSVLVCYATGAFAERIEKMTNKDIEKEAMDALRVAFLDKGKDNDVGVISIPDPVRMHVTRWRSDPFARGSWTFFKAGTRGMEDVSAFQTFNSEKGAEEMTYFAGEHTCDGSIAGLDIGTVHGAYLSGTLAAEKLLANTFGDKIDPTLKETADEDMYDDYEWKELPPKIQAAFAVLGFTKELWNNGGEPETEDLDWIELSQEQRVAASFFGYTEESWDADSETYNESIAALCKPFVECCRRCLWPKRATRSWDKRSYCNDDWDELPQKIKDAASTLGYDRNMWESNGIAWSDDYYWSELSKMQQKAAALLGYDECSWDDDR